MPVSDSSTIGQALIAHCTAAALAGYERNGWFGATSNKNLTAMFDDVTSQLNHRHVAAVGQDIRIVRPDGKSAWVGPKYLAVLCAGMQAGTPIATPLTWKRPSVLDVRGGWKLNLDAAEAISKGVCTISRDNLGFRIERSVTTHLEDDNPIYSEVSANESANYSVRDLRAALIGQIGGAVYVGTAKRLESVVKTRLDKQVQDQGIKAWRNASVEDLGDTFRINYEVAAVEPLNFIQITASVVRIAA